MMALFALLLAAVPAQAESVRGDFNGWNPTWMAQDADFGNIWTVTFLNNTNFSPASFKFDQDGDYNPEWGSGAGSQNVSLNTGIGQVRGSASGDTIGNMSVGVTSGLYLTFRLSGDSTYWDRNFVVMGTDSEPVDITSVSDDHLSAGTNDITVSLGLSAAKSSQETFFVRWSNDGFSSSSLAEASGSGTNYTATIPGQAPHARVSYYVISSTLFGGTVDTNPDLCTLRGANNDGSNYVYHAGGGNSWHIPTNAEPSGATMRNPAADAPADAAVWFYNGTFANLFDQSGGTLHYRESGAGTWSSTNLSYDSSSASGGSTNKYWSTSILADTFANADTVEYYLEITYNDCDTTYIGTTDSGVSSTTFLSESDAQANLFSFTYAGSAPVQTGTVWHIPTNAEPTGVTMRNPETPAADVDVYFYNGVYTNESDQSGGWLMFRKTGASWSSNSLGYNNQEGANKYWYTNISADTYANGDTIEYYFQCDFTDDDTTYIGTTNDGAGCVLYTDMTTAAANPFTFTYEAAPADLGNAWHVPGNYEPQGAYMRNPRNPYANNAVYFYNGNQFQGAGNPGDQSGGNLYYRLKGDVAWTPAALAFDIEAENNKYWKANIPADTFVATNEVEYYFLVTYSDHDNTWLGTTNSGATSTPFADEADAQSNPFSFIYGGEAGDEPAFMWHASNVVKVSESSAQFWIKMGYAEGTGSNRWADNCAIYYTTNGTDPVITGHGTNGNADTFVQALTFSHMEEDTYEGGDSMWWQANVTNLPNNQSSSVRYKIGAWNSAGNNVERFAEFNTQEGGIEQIFVYSLYVAGADGLQVNGVNADYTTTKFFINEIDGDEVEIVVHYKPADENVKNVEIYSNLGRRDYVNVDYTNAYITADGFPDGICPPDGNLISTNDTGAYFIAIPMEGGPTDYYWTGTVSRCGAYRLTARYQTEAQSGTNWTWYSTDGLRDHAIVISPTKTHEMTLYELNTLTINADSATEGGRSTFADLTNSANGKFNLEWLNYIQANCLWFQPIHPSADTTRGDPSGYTPGSPYATKDYFAVAKWFGDAATESDAMAEFTNFVIACDNYGGSVGTINIMLDGVFNHTSWDAVMGQGGVDLGYAADPADSMGSSYPGWYSLWTDYGEPATYYHGVWSNDFATAPDRGDFGKWDDVSELYFGKYSALVRHNPDDNANYKNEGDVYDFTGMSTDTKKLWRYFAYYADFWLEKTGHAGTNSWVETLDNKGLDALRCDFGQGLPPQFWEYFINHTRSMKWNFVFMAETLDGGIPGYRSNRHFDILNEDIVFKFTQAHISQAWEFKDAYEQRRNAYNGGAVLLNLTGHDEVMPETDPWMTASRYGCNAMIDGLPMIFYGQEKGIQPATGTIGGQNQGFELYELNFGKYIVNFKQWNKATFWDNPPAGSDGMDQWYGRVNWARLNSPALRSMNRYFLERTEGGDNAKILAAAKYETWGAGPAANDVVLAFSLILDSSHSPANDTYDLQGPWGALGMNTGKWYNVRNLASSDASAYVWSVAQSGQDLYDNGIWVGLNADDGQSITNDGALVQFLKVEEVPAPVPVPDAPTVNPASSTNETSFTASWNAAADATNYLLDVAASATFSSSTLIDENFDGSFPPTGWSQVSVDQSDTYAHSGTYSAKLGAGGDELITPQITNGQTLTFWRYTTSADPDVLVAWSTDKSAWSVIATNNGSTEVWTQHSLDISGLGAGYIRFQKDGTGTLYIDDVNVTGSGGFVPGYEARSVGNVTSASVTGLTAETTYYYRLRAQNNAGFSEYSATQSVTTISNTPGSYTITATGGLNGEIDPAGSVSVSAGANQAFIAMASNLYRIADITTNGSSIGIAFGNEDTIYEFTWTNVQDNGAIHATFTGIVTTNNPAEVPETWLDTYYPGTSSYANAAISDTDNDTLEAWQEYIAGTDPTDENSTLKAAPVVDHGIEGNIISWMGTAEANRLYSIYWTDDLLNPLSALVTNIPSANPTMNVYTDTTHSADATIYYRVKVQKTE
jgi:hypothetical protein